MNYQLANAQSSAMLLLQPPETKGFPNLSFQFKLNQLTLHQNTTLSVDQLRVIENGQQVPILSLNKEKIGVHFTLAINGGYDLAVRDASAVSNFDKLRSILIDWVTKRIPARKDSWTFVPNQGEIMRNQVDSEVWIDALDSYQPNFRSMESDLTSLESALELAQNRVVNFGVDKVLLYITLPLKPDQISTVHGLVEKAREAGIYVNVWMVGDPYFLTNEQGGALMALASDTGGQFFHFTGNEPIPDPELYLDSLGLIYTLTYESGIRKTGSFPLRLEVSLSDEVISGECASFYLDVCPPNPILLSPPAEITRICSQDPDENPLTFQPDQIELSFMMTFPDDHPRQIVASRLYVDGRVADVHTAPPFETLTWDLTDLTESGEHTIAVEVEDALGMSARTILTPIQIVILQPEPQPHLSGKQIGLILAGVILLAALLLLALWAFRRFLQRSNSREVVDRLSRIRKSREVTHITETLTKGDTLAALLPLGVLDQDWEHQAKYIKQCDVIFGSEPDKVDIALDAKDVDGVQAQLRLVEGAFWLNDLGSSQGTWMNYNQIGTEPVKVMSGDVIHFGNTGYRFRILDTKIPCDVTVNKYKPLL